MSKSNSADDVFYDAEEHFKINGTKSYETNSLATSKKSQEDYLNQSNPLSLQILERTKRDQISASQTSLRKKER
jgi:hypothetical protein